MNTDCASLPSPYELVVRDRVDSVLAEGVRHARSGRDEGTLIWAMQQETARTRRGYNWFAPPDNLHCALVMRPQHRRCVAWQLCHVAAVAAGAAIAEELAPMTGLEFEWPGDLLVNGLHCGRIDLEASPAGNAEHYEWVVIGIAVNVAHHPQNPEPERFNSIHASGDADTVTARVVLEHFARHFLRWVNIWADSGYGPIRQAWLQRAHTLVDSTRLSDRLPDIACADLCLSDDGTLLLTNSDGRRQRFSIGDYFSLPA